MTRPSKNTDQKLIEAAKVLIPKVGFTHLKVRDVAKKAGVNLGMFNYHFKTKDKFIEVLLKMAYEEFFQNFTIESKSGSNSLECFQNAVMTISRFVKDNRKIIFPLMMEINQGNKKIMEFVKKNMTRHVDILLDLLRECQREGFIKEGSLFNIMPIVMGSIIIPVLLMNIFEKSYDHKLIPALLMKGAGAVLMSDDSIKQRIDLVLKGIAKEFAYEKK